MCVCVYVYSVLVPHELELLAWLVEALDLDDATGEKLRRSKIVWSVVMCIRAAVLGLDTTQQFLDVENKLRYLL